MQKAIGVLKARMKEYKEIGSDTAMEYYHSCKKAVNALESKNETLSALESSLQMLEQTLTYRKANGLSFGNIFLEATISQVKEAISKAES